MRQFLCTHSVSTLSAESCRLFSVPNGEIQEISKPGSSMIFIFNIWCILGRF